MRFRSYLIITAIFISFPLKAQNTDLSSRLERLFDRIMHSRIDQEKIATNDSIRLIIESYAASDTVFSHKFANLRYLGQIMSPDSRIKILTWNLILRDGTNNYYSYILHRENRRGKHTVYKLTGKNSQISPNTERIYSADDWYGALYYAVSPFKIKNKTFYILLGFDYGNLQVSRKIADVLSFSPQGELSLGEGCFKKDNETKFRVVIEYSPEGIASLRFHSKKLIVFDHLVSFSENQNANPEYFGAEFTFDGYRLKKGFWIFASDVEVKNKK